MAQPDDLADTESLIADYYSIRCDPGEPAQRVVFGTNGHRGSASSGTFNDDHVAAISQAIVDHRTANHVAGPLFMGRDTHALSAAQDTAMEVFAANGVTLVLDAADGYVPTPAVSHAILRHNREHAASAADGVVITPSHNPPTDGGYKYNDAHGGPADAGATSWIQERANRLLADRLTGVRRIPSARALTAASTVRYDYLGHYVADLSEVVDLRPVRAAGLRIGADPLGGASVAYWDRIAETYGLDLAVVNPVVDPTWRFMALDWDGRIRMDCSSADTMAPLIARRGDYDITVANDADADRHGIVTPDAGLLPPNHFLAAAIAYLHGHRKAWPPTAGIGKSMVTSGMIDRIAAHVRRPLVEVPVGFKWFGEGLRTGSLCWGGEESAGASFARRDGSVWTTDKDGIAPALLAAEMTAVTGRTLRVLPRPHRPLRRTRLRARRRACHRRAEGTAVPARTGIRAERHPGGSGRHRRPDRRARYRNGFRRNQGDRRRRLVRGAPLGDRGRVQDLRGILPRPRAPRQGAPRGRKHGGGRARLVTRVSRTRCADRETTGIPRVHPPPDRSTGRARFLSCRTGRKRHRPHGAICDSRSRAQIPETWGQRASIPLPFPWDR